MAWIDAEEILELTADAVAADAAVDTAIERMRADGADLVLTPSTPIGPDKHSATSTIRRYEYDPDMGHWARDGDAIPVES